MDTLTEFLAENPVEDLREEVVVSQRLREHPFEIKGAYAGEMESYARACRRREQGKTVFDAAKCNVLLILNHCTAPDFRSVDFLRKCGCATPEEAVNKVLKAGEIAFLAQKIYALSGYGESMEDLKATVKN